MIERIDELSAQARAAIAGAASSEDLEELRVRYLGRKAELPQLLRGVAELPPEQRAVVGKAANQARQELEGLIEARDGRAERRRAGAPAARGRRRRDAARGARRSRSGDCTS